MLPKFSAANDYVMFFRTPFTSICKTKMAENRLPVTSEYILFNIVNVPLARKTRSEYGFL